MFIRLGIVVFLLLALPVLTEQLRYEIAEGLASVTYTDNNVATNTMTLAATSGTTYARSDRNEVSGLFSAVGSGFNMKGARFRIQLPRGLRGN